MVPLARLMVTRDTVRFLIATLGVAFANTLMLFLFATTEGVRREANGYVSQRTADVWLSHRNATNLFRSTSFLQASLLNGLREVAGVREISPLIRLIATSRIDEHDATFFVFGIDADAPLVRPQVVRGSTELAPGDIILDRAFAAKHGLNLGDSLLVQEQTFRVVALSQGTNAFLMQFAFITMEDAQRLLDLGRDLVSFFLVTAQPGISAEQLAENFQQAYPRLSAFTQSEFSSNNLEELRVGVFPVLGSIAFAGATLGVAVLTLMLYGNVIDKRDAYAVLKALGASQRFLMRLVLQQALLLSIGGFVVGLCLYALGTPLLIRLVPEMAQALTWPIASGVLGTTVLMGLLSAWVPIARLGRIYPAEVFRA